MVADYVGKSLSQRLPEGQVTCTFLNCGRDQILGNGNLEYQPLHKENTVLKTICFVIMKCLFLHFPRNAGNQCRKLAFTLMQKTLFHMDSTC
jgi:hypothetical protein